jgi:hypothetical protein
MERLKANKKGRGKFRALFYWPVDTLKYIV